MLTPLSQALCVALAADLIIFAIVSYFIYIFVRNNFDIYQKYSQAPSQLYSYLAHRWGG